MGYDIDTIEKIAELVREELWSKDGKIDPIIIAKNLGFSVYESDFDDDNISGYIKNSTDEKAIYVNKKDFSGRKLFTIAHEIGHAVLHQETLNDDYEHIDYRRTTQFDIKEMESNAFAAALLMPREESNRIWNKYRDVDDFADHFGVSKSAASYRLQNLSLI